MSNLNLKSSNLYLANNIEALNLLADEKINKQPIPQNFDKKCRSLEVLYKNAIDFLPKDQEKAYVFFRRFLTAYHKYLVGPNDLEFKEKRFSTQVTKCRQYLNQLEWELSIRYAEKQAEKLAGRGAMHEDDDIVVSRGPTDPTVRQKKFPENCISCGKLYSALTADKSNILLVDARCEEDFETSRIKIGNMINIPDHIIESGMSAHSIGKALPESTQKLWDRRDTFDILVLLDWNSTLETISGTKLEKLLSSLTDWDTNRTYFEKPIILNGGYTEWALKYPSYSIEPHVVFNRTYDDLDELLDLDNIEYPEEPKSRIIDFKEIKAKTAEPVVVATPTREELIRESKEISMRCKTVLQQIVEEEKKWKDMREKGIDIEQLRHIETGILKLDAELKRLKEQKTKTEEQFGLYAKFDPQREDLGSDEINEIVDIDREDDLQMEISRVMAVDRKAALAKARALKPAPTEEPRVCGDSGATIGTSGDAGTSTVESADPSSGEVSTSSLPTPYTGPSTSHARPRSPRVHRPAVNRSTKPMISEGIFNHPVFVNREGGGLVGLTNIRNTCYMNTVLQCMRTIPTIATLFCTGLYTQHIRRKPSAIIMETALVFRSLWSNIHRSFIPQTFYDRVCSIESNYGSGNHEDCMEFFLFFLNLLSEDCAYDVQKPTTMTPVQEAWFNQMCGKMSIFTELFYHQLRIKQVCPECRKVSYKFEIESTVMLSVTEYDFSLEDLMRSYMEDYVIDDYYCSTCRVPVKNTKSVSVAPQILVIVLKRYKQRSKDNITKVTSRATFPKSGLVFGNYRYKLDSIAMHLGSMTSGHYTAACSINSKWYEFNDEIVRPLDVDDDSVRTKACAFFYSKESNK